MDRFDYCNVVACSGTSVTAAQREVLKRFPHIVIGFDADEPGRHAATRLYDDLKFDVPLIRIANWGLIDNGLGDYCKDPGEIKLKSEIDYVFDDLTDLKRFSKVA
jgi:DNA primase